MSQIIPDARTRKSLSGRAWMMGWYFLSGFKVIWPVEPSQCMSLELDNRRSDWGLSASFGSTGVAFDHATMESVLATAPCEKAFLH